jgi:hypothetical protein
MIENIKLRKDGIYSVRGNAARLADAVRAPCGVVSVERVLPALDRIRSRTDLIPEKRPGSYQSRQGLKARPIRIYFRPRFIALVNAAR